MGILVQKYISVTIFLIGAWALLGSVNFGVTAEKEIPMTRFGQHVGGPTMSFFYCYSCGYRKAFEEYVNIISDKYPQISVTGRNYDPPGFSMYLSKVIFCLKFVFIVLIATSTNIFWAIGRGTPTWWQYLLDNKAYACMMFFFLGNMLEAHLVSSGAFEIILNDVPVWSKLETGRIPVPQELFQIIDNQMQFTDTIQGNSDFARDHNLA